MNDNSTTNDDTIINDNSTINNNIIIKNKKNKIGGKVIGSGGYGCVFLPALKCNNSNMNNNQNELTISKVMDNEDADSEYKKINDFKNILKIIPNYEKYFMLNITEMCHPKHFSNDDLINYNSKCSELIRRGLKHENINNNLTKIKTINMPFGGNQIGKFIRQNYNSSDLIKLNNSLIKLLKYGIIPMNELNVFHADIKDSNVLALKNKYGEIETKIIDWGISYAYNNSNNLEEISRKIGKGVQFNSPISVVLFDSLFNIYFNEFFKNKPEWNYKNVQIFSANYLNKYVLKYKNKLDHLKLMLLFIDMLKTVNTPLFGNKKISSTSYIVMYISDIIFKFTNNYVFSKINYVNQVYLKNVDVWGFLTIYIEIFELISNNTPNNSNNAILAKIKNIVLNTLFENSNKPINKEELINKLLDLNIDLKKININGIKQNQKAGTKRIKNKNNKTIKIKN